MMIDRLEGNSELKTSVRLMLGGRRMTHSVLLVGEEGLGNRVCGPLRGGGLPLPQRRRARRSPAPGRVLPCRGKGR